ncbi:MAG: periplasmic protein TonB [Acidobacteriota bacterium]|jgi:protein TonB|nr:periplasmic protein TonB [Acidobacteriota bacterium]
MFETVAPEAFHTRTHQAAYRSLPVSIATHVIILAVFLIAPQWRAVFPDQPPRLVRPYSIAAAPAPPPPLPSGAPARPANPATPVPASTPVAPPPELEVAPTVIPDSIPVVPMRTATLSLAAFTALPSPTGASDGQDGTGGGSGSGSGNGVAEGKRDGLLGGVMVGDRVLFGRNVNLPLYVEKKLFPQYPEDARMLHREDDVTLRYVIGKDGHVREVVVLEHPRWPKFEESAVRAIRTWRFRPFKVDGEAHEVEHELVVSFRLE